MERTGEHANDQVDLVVSPLVVGSLTVAESVQAGWALDLWNWVAIGIQFLGRGYFLCCVTD